MSGSAQVVGGLSDCLHYFGMRDIGNRQPTENSYRMAETALKSLAALTILRLEGWRAFFPSNLRYWHLTDVDADAQHVRFQG